MLSGVVQLLVTVLFCSVFVFVCFLFFVLFFPYKRYKAVLPSLTKWSQKFTPKNNIYPDSMTEATRIAVKAKIDSNRIMKHVFTFLALCAPEPMRLHLLTTYVVNADGELDERK